LDNLERVRHRKNLLLLAAAGLSEHPVLALHRPVHGIQHLIERADPEVRKRVSNQFQIVNRSSELRAKEVKAAAARKTVTSCPKRRSKAGGGSSQVTGWAALARLIERRIDEARVCEKFCWKHGFPDSEKRWNGHASGLVALVKEVPALARRVKVPPIDPSSATAGN
jgi:hypothetical protein